MLASPPQFLPHDATLERGIATASRRLSARLSVRPWLRYRDHIG